MTVNDRQEGWAPEAWAKLSDAQRADILAHISGLTCEDGFYDPPARGWCCFHCGEYFRTEAGARLHFGEKVTGRPACVTDLFGPIIEAADAADAAGWPVTTWAVPVDALRRVRDRALGTVR